MGRHSSFDVTPYKLTANWPNLAEWVSLLPMHTRALHADRAEQLLAAAPEAGPVVLRVLAAERRLALWGIRAERARRTDKKVLIEALKEMGRAESDAARAWSEYVRERDAAAGNAAALPASAYVDLLG